MKTFFKSFYAKASAIFLVLMLLLVLAVSWFCVRAVLQYEIETDQRLNMTLAEDLVVKFQPWVVEKIDEMMLKMEIDKLMGINRRIEIYLLEEDGTIRAHYLPDDRDLYLASVDTQPIQAYLAGADIPILGDDPLQIDRKKPFSVAPISLIGDPGYLYVILGGEYYDSAGALIRDNYVFRLASIGVGSSVLVTGLLGLILFGLLANRLVRIRNGLCAFEGGNLTSRIRPTSNDEIAQLGRSFDQMADTIVRNMEQLKQADTLRRELIANISHDLRSPLASIQGYLETVLIKDEKLKPEERRLYVETGLKNTKKLNKLVDALFELSKLDAGQIEPQFEKFSIAELVQDVVMQFKPQAEKQDIELTAELAEGPLPMVYADIGLVERAISNLIDNAIRHTPNGGKVSIVPTRGTEEHVSVAVVDSGKGIPEAELSRIFERFYRVEKSRTPGTKAGSGLGLAIAKRIFELHGSALSVQSALNVGTTFHFKLPTTPDIIPLGVEPERVLATA